MRHRCWGECWSGSDEALRSEPVVVLSYAFWERHFGRDPGVIGRVIRLNDKPATVVGVVSAEFGGLSFDAPAVWAPIQQQPYFAAGSQLLTDFSVNSSTGVQFWGRLQPGLTPRIVEDELKIARRGVAGQQHPDDIWKARACPANPAATPRVCETETGMAPAVTTTTVWCRYSH